MTYKYIFESTTKEISKKYLPHIQESMEIPEVSEFANTLYTNAQSFYAGTITQEQFDDGIYLTVFDTDSDVIKQAKNGLNYMKEKIATCSE
jgi:hypothetical protein